MTDKERLDWLEEQNKKASYTGKCRFRWSITGRGWRLHETSSYELDRVGLKHGPFATVREAIDYAIENDKENTGV